MCWRLKLWYISCFFSISWGYIYLPGLNQKNIFIPKEKKYLLYILISNQEEGKINEKLKKKAFLHVPKWTVENSNLKRHIFRGKKSGALLLLILKYFSYYQEHIKLDECFYSLLLILVISMPIKSKMHLDYYCHWATLGCVARISNWPWIYFLMTQIWKWQ